jgi:membrane protein DedA with SNARE-associated domain
VIEAISTFVKEHPHLVEAAVFALGFAESILLVSFIVPSSAIFIIVGGFLGATGHMLWPVVFAAAAGSLLGDLVSYAFGHRYRHEVKQWEPLKSNPDWLTRTRAFVRQYGWLSVIIGKFVGPIRPIVPIVCGVSRMQKVRFTAAAGIGSLVWAAAFLVPPYYGLALFSG